MVIEITKRYIIDDCTLKNIINDYSEYYDENGEFTDFNDFLSCFLEDELSCEEEIIEGNVEQIKEICELQVRLDKLKEKYLL